MSNNIYDILGKLTGLITPSEKTTELTESTTPTTSPLKEAIAAMESKFDTFKETKIDELSKDTLKSYADKRGDQYFTQKKPASGPDLDNYARGLKKLHKKEKEVTEGSKPDYLDLDKDGDKKEPMKKAAKEKKVVESDEDWGSMGKREFKRRELEHELAGEESMNGYGIFIGGKFWKAVKSKNHADSIVKTLKAKGKDAKSIYGAFFESREVSEDMSGDDVMAHTGPSEYELNQTTAEELDAQIKHWSKEGMRFNEIADIVMAMVDDGAVSFSDARKCLEKAKSGRPVMEDTFNFVGKAWNKVDGEKSAKTKNFSVKAKDSKAANDKAIKKMHKEYPDCTNHSVKLDESGIVAEKAVMEDTFKMVCTAHSKADGWMPDAHFSVKAKTRKEALKKAQEKMAKKYPNCSCSAEIVEPEVVSEKAVSKAQQKFFGMVHAAQKGEKPASKEVAKAAKSISKKEATKFAKTKHKGLPKHVTESRHRMMEAHSTFEHILQRFPAEVKQFESTGNLDGDLYDSLYDYYFNTGEMPYAVSKGRSGDPMSWVSDRFEQDLGIGNESNVVDHFDELDEISRLAGLETQEDAMSLPQPDSVSPLTHPEEIMDEFDMEEGNAFSGALNAAKASGETEFEVDGKKYTVKEDVNLNVTANGEEDVVNLIRKLSGMPVATVATSEPEDEMCDHCSQVLDSIDEEPVEEERDIEYVNTPDEKVAPLSAAYPSGSDLHRAKKSYSGKPYRGDNPMAESIEENTLWKKYSDMLQGLIK